MPFCKQVSPQCPVEASTYGYVPNLAGNVVLLVIFALALMGQVILAIRHRVWAFGIVVTIGCLFEVLGYIGRLLMRPNVWDIRSFQLQIVSLILAPSFLAAGIYLTLKHLVAYFGSQYSRLSPVLYVWIFVGCDVVSILLQAAGGGVAATLTTDLSVLDRGNKIMVAGIIFQVATMAVCIALALDFAFTLFRKRNEVREHSQAHGSHIMSKSFRFYLSCNIFAFITIFIRCIYRVPELYNGWGNPLMRNETEFLLLDGMMIALATTSMTIAHPGLYFPAISSKYREHDTSGTLETQQRGSSPDSALGSDEKLSHSSREGL